MDKPPLTFYAMRMGHLDTVKTMIRAALPARWRTPAAFFAQQARGRLEPETALLPWLVQPDDLAVDVGAHHGVYCRALTKLGARVEAFEPNPAIAANLAAWAARRAGVRVHALALSDRAGTAELVIPHGDDGVRHPAAASIAAYAAARGDRIAVPTQRIDHFGFDPPAFIKIDVEGHEAAALAGARQTIAVAAPAMLIEIEQRHIAEPIAAAFARVLALGYQGFFLDAGRLRPLGEFDRERHQSTQAFAQARGGYCNNFLFLAQTRLSRGDYRGLLQRWAAA